MVIMPRPNTFRIGSAGEVTVDWRSECLEVTYSGSASHALYVALDDREGMGSPIVPFGQGWEGSTVFLPFSAKSIVYVKDGVVYHRSWRNYSWSERSAAPHAQYSLGSVLSPHMLSLRTAASGRLGLVAYVKDLRENSGWGSRLGSQ